ncbi:MAG: NUDIX hydrolase [Alphaproteobacteria bacterium]|nr:NUDIX hydrolase [Alphaproteobacteria bacterium]MDE1986130.1 NUDIX hydrolase [Alphaproteobacteria bacterium]MDE2162875.1 NUDIX hydrolase [Alphaproteobacteria bacterium]MDE2265338.1 NUDIX hydrolase [Alphaproteobacteria bacterium]MDE2501018.1 NUDIX hydrolase [Alphaproteobacteria bacterium]
MDRKVVVEKRSLLLDDYFKVEEAYVSYEKFDGTMSRPVRRLDFVRGDAVAAILFNTQRKRVILVSQFRYATLSRGIGWMTEAVAGLIDSGETPEEAVKREILEEAGYEVETLERIFRFYPTPGVTSERVILYYAETRGDEPVAKGGGLAHENEDIQVVELPLDLAFAQIDHGEIVDAKTIIGLMWLRQRAERERNE